MTQSLSAESIKACPSKRKGTRSVSTMTPSQLARKRAIDREAQRANRARTKEHIERLERELEDLRSIQSHDRTIQDLLRRNKALEDELRWLKESMEISIPSSPYSTSLADTEESCGAIPSRRMSPLPSGGAECISDYSQATQQYMPKPNCDACASPSTLPSPPSSVNTDKDVSAAAYIPTSVLNSMIGTACSGHVEGKEVKLEYEGMPDMMSSQGYMHHSQKQQQQQQHQLHHRLRPLGWNMYPGMYCDGSQNTAISR